MRTSLVLMGLVIIALCRAFPTKSHNRQKRGFRMNSSNRVAHGFGKRQFSAVDDNWFAPLPSDDLMTVQELAQLSADNPSLTEALIEKFIDTDGDGYVSVHELFAD